MIGDRLADRYEIVGELGRGGMGVVYRARDPQLNRDVAIKLIAPTLLTPETERRFKAEAQLVARLDHPSIVSIHDFGQHQGSLFFVMPVVEGASLRQLLRDKSLLLGDILDIGIAVADVLEYSQAHRVIHRDIKPENIMITQEEGAGLRVRVMDFGLARASEVTGITKTGMLLGTMAYISPEQASGRAVDTRSDIYSLGTVLYECVTGDVPFAGDVQAILYRVVHEIAQPPRERGAAIDEELEGIILGCLGKDPADRPQKPAELLQALRRYRTGLRDSERNRSVMVTRAVQAPRAGLAPFAGRKDESRLLQQRLNAAVAGQCQFVVVSGEPGAGKTRLLDELEKIARARQIQVLHGRFVEHDGAFPYYGFCEAIQDHFRQRESGSLSGAPPDLSDLGADLISLFPTLGEIDAFRSGSAGDLRPAEAAESRLPENRTQIFELLARALTRIAGGQPLVLLLEDLHGADVSIEALRYIVRRLGPTATLIIATYRSSDVDRRHPLTAMLEGFTGDRNYAAVELRPLTPSEHRELLSTLIGGSRVSDELAERLFESTEGNPYFTKELVRSLMDAGNIVRDATGIWSLSGGTEISTDALPATIQQAVEKRIARLPEEMRDILSIAAVMGKTFDFRDLEVLCGDEAELDEAVDRLIKEGLIEEERQSRGDALTFTSGVVRDVLYAELSRRKRRSLHRKYATQLEKRHAGRLDRVFPQLVYHYSAGDVPEKTVEYGMKHARRSLDAFSPEEAIRSVRTALEFLDEEWEGERAVEGEARMLLAGACQLSGDADGALRELTSALKVYEREDDSARTIDALLQAARLAWQARRSEQARAWVERGISVSRGAGDRDRLGQFLNLAATIANLRGEYQRAAEHLKEAEELGQSAQQEGLREDIPDGGRLVVALANPLIATEPAAMELAEEWEVYTNIFEPLVRSGGQGELIPSLCERWEVRDEGRSCTLTLRPEVRFHDDTPLTAAHIKACFERSIRQATTDLAPAFLPIRGVQEFIARQADTVAGLVAAGAHRLEIHLGDPLPIYPALLTDARAAVYLFDPAAEERGLIGTGPFRLVSRDDAAIRLERHPGYWRGTPSRIEELEFRAGMSPAAISAGLEQGEIDVAGDLRPADLERLLGDPRLRNRLAETSKMTTYFAIFSSHSRLTGKSEQVRRALASVVRPHDLVWKTLGRFAQPAVGLIPPGMLGHDPGRRRHLASMDEARSLLREAGAPESMTLRAAVHPIVRDRYGALFEALCGVWKELGVTLSIETPDIASFIKAMAHGTELDAGLFRWVADYNDPDNFTHNLFHSRTGQFRSFYSAGDTDEMLDAARREPAAGGREALYRKFENQILQSGFIVPLFHDVDFRLASAKVRGLKVRNTYPAVNYAELGKAEAAPAAAPARREAGGIIQIPMSASLAHLDPGLTHAAEDSDVLAAIYEPLTRVREGRIEPLLAQEFRVEEGGRKYRFRLRDGVRFHDGRRTTGRDVRYSIERLLVQKGCARRTQFNAIRGAQEVIDGKATELTGFHIHSAQEFTIELTAPVSFFPVLMSDIVAGIVPEGSGRGIGKSGTQGAIGTGPFRVARFEPDQRLELEYNPYYWREGSPRGDGLVFSFGIPPEEILAGFKAGRYSLASDLPPGEVEPLRRDPQFAAAYREVPFLSTYFVMFNRKRGPLADIALRRRLVEVVDAPAIVRQTMGRRAIPAHGLIPPGLLGFEPSAGIAADSGPVRPENLPTAGGELNAAIHPLFAGEYAEFYKLLEVALRSAGVGIRRATRDMAEFIEAWETGSADLMIGRWVGDYPDADTFANFLNTQGLDGGAYAGSPDIDRMIEKGRLEIDPVARHAIYRELETMLRREALMIPLFHEQVYRFARPELEGLTVSFTTPTINYSDLRIRRG